MEEEMDSIYEYISILLFVLTNLPKYSWTLYFTTLFTQTWTELSAQSSEFIGSSKLKNNNHPSSPPPKKYN